MKLFRFNLRLLLNKITIILLISTIIFVLLIDFIEINSLFNNESDETNSLMFLQNSLFYTKLIISFVGIYLFSYMITPKGDYVLYVIRMFNYNRSQLFICKFLTVVLVMIIVSLSSLVIFFIIGNIYIKNFYSNNCIKVYLNLCLLSVDYGLIGLILMQLINNYFVIIVTCVISLFISGIEEDTILNKLIVFFLPKMSEDGKSIYGSLHLFWIMIVYFLIGFFIYLKRDLNY